VSRTIGEGKREEWEPVQIDVNMICWLASVFRHQNPPLFDFDLKLVRNPCFSFYDKDL
jgi:hypothetical protein